MATPEEETTGFPIHIILAVAVILAMVAFVILFLTMGTNEGILSKFLKGVFAFMSKTSV